MYWTLLPSPIGALTLASDGTAITGLWMSSHRALPAFSARDACPSLPVLRLAEAWLSAYFSQEALPPMPPLSPAGTPFQRQVWTLLQEIPLGDTTTYGAISNSLQARGISSSPQAVGGAVGRNPISILIPCHRVVGADGSLTGYAGGVELKRRLLKLEGSL